MLGRNWKYRKTQMQECLEMVNRTAVTLIERLATRSISWRNLTVCIGLSIPYWFSLKLHLIRFDELLCCLSSNRKSLHVDEWASSFPSPFSTCFFFFFIFFFLGQLSNLCLFLWAFLSSCTSGLPNISYIVESLCRFTWNHISHLRLLKKVHFGIIW